MKKIILSTCLFAALLACISCSKDKAVIPPPPVVPTVPNPPPPPPANGPAFSLANSEWTGTAGTYGQTYPQPLYLRFNGDTTVSLYALFAWVLNGVSYEPHDSSIGKITSIDTVTNGVITITVDFPFTKDQQVYTITDKKSLRGASIAGATADYHNVFTCNLGICPKNFPSVSGTNWATNKMVGGATDGMYEFPDITTFSFATNGFTSYIRNGKIITYTPPDQTNLIIYRYQQIGPRIYFAGYNETNDKLIVYYGVFTPDGKTILADARNRADTRLPNYLQTIYWYGPPGVTPHTQFVN